MKVKHNLPLMCCVRSREGLFAAVLKLLHSFSSFEPVFVQGSAMPLLLCFRTFLVSSESVCCVCCCSLRCVLLTRVVSFAVLKSSYDRAGPVRSRFEVADRIVSHLSGWKSEWLSKKYLAKEMWGWKESVGWTDALSPLHCSDVCVVVVDC